MKAITLWQPWASLIAEGVKSIETRPKRSPWSSAVGETIAIHAAKRTPTVPDYIGPYNLGYWAEEVRHVQPCDCDFDNERTGERCMANSLGVRHTLFTFEGEWPVPAIDLPLGAVVATARLVDVVPMAARRRMKYRPGVIVVNPFDPRLRLYRDAGRDGADVSDQLPFGEFAPGRYALLLDEISKLPEPIPARGNQGLWTWAP